VLVHQRCNSTSNASHCLLRLALGVVWASHKLVNVWVCLRQRWRGSLSWLASSRAGMPAQFWLISIHCFALLGFPEC
jgi:hypothetical protein